MPRENGPGKGSRWIRVDGAVRLIDAPNSRMGLEVDLGLLPWDPFDALGKKVTVLVPTPQSENGPGEEETNELHEAIRFVAHAADRCKDFAEAGNGDSSSWWNAYRTWDWLRDHLAREWEDEETAPSPDLPAGESEQLPSLPGAASILEYTLGALRTIPLKHWEETVGTLDPEAPSREEAIRTVQVLSSLLRRPAGEVQPDPAPSMEVPTSQAQAVDPSASAEPSNVSAEPSEREGSGQEEAPERRATPSRAAESRQETAQDQEADMSFEYAHGFDEGYRTGRRVGFALGNHARRKGQHSPDQP